MHFSPHLMREKAIAFQLDQLRELAGPTASLISPQVPHKGRGRVGGRGGSLGALAMGTWPPQRRMSAYAPRA